MDDKTIFEETEDEEEGSNREELLVSGSLFIDL
jgi:hypothetical protein